MMQRAAPAHIRQFLWAIIVGACFPFCLAHAQDSSDPVPDNAETIDEIVVVVDRLGKQVDLRALRLEEARIEVLREFGLQQHKQEEEFWRLRLRSAMKRNTSRIAWGYDAQTDAAEFRYTQANYLSIDRVRPATIVSIRF